MNARPIRRRAALVTIAAIGLALAAPAAAEVAAAAPSLTQAAGASTEARDAQPTSRSGVWVNIYNRSGKTSFTVKDRDTGQTFEVKPRESKAFDRGFASVSDEVELSVHAPGQEAFDIDVANPTLSWPNVTVDGDNENFSVWETKFFASGDSRIEVQRHDDQNDRKRFFINITPPGPLS
jgi:hypothetical protein